MSTEIPEADKPFYLAMVAAGITILNIVLLGVGSYLHNKAMADNALETLKFTFPLTTMAWAFYFKGK